LKIVLGMTWPMRLRALHAAGGRGLNSEPRGAASVMGRMQPSLFGVSGSSRHFSA
jgi:hypothetical protein